MSPGNILQAPPQPWFQQSCDHAGSRSGVMAGEVLLGKWGMDTGVQICTAVCLSGSQTQSSWGDFQTMVTRSMAPCSLACLWLASLPALHRPPGFLDGPSRPAQKPFKAQCSLDSLTPAPSDGPSLPAFLKEYLKS